MKLQSLRPQVLSWLEILEEKVKHLEEKYENLNIDIKDFMRLT